MYRFRVEIPEIRLKTKMGESRREEREDRNSTNAKSEKQTLERLASPLELSSRSPERIRDFYVTTR